MQRGRRRRGKSGGPPRPREQIRLPQGLVSACKLPGKFVSRALNLFLSVQDKILPGTLHHSGIRPAPPSDHTPLARRSAFLRARQRAGNSKARAGLKRLQGNSCRGGRGHGVCQHMNHGTLRFRSRYAEEREISMNHRGVEYTLTRSENPGFWKWQSDRRSGQVGKDRSKACPVGHAPRPVKDRSLAEARGAPTDVLIGVCTGYSRPLSAPFAGPTGA